MAGDLARVGVARLRLDRAAAAFPEIQQLGYFATLAEELDVDSDDDDWAGPDALRDMDAVEANRVVTARLGRRILAIMGYPKDSAIDADQPLTELGMDSLMAVRIRNTVRGDFGVEPPVALLLQGASLADLDGRSHPSTRPQRAGQHRERERCSRPEPSSVPQRGNEPRRGER